MSADGAFWRRRGRHGRQEAFKPDLRSPSIRRDKTTIVQLVLTAVFTSTRNGSSPLSSSLHVSHDSVFQHEQKKQLSHLVLLRLGPRGRRRRKKNRNIN